LIKQYHSLNKGIGIFSGRYGITHVGGNAVASAELAKLFCPRGVRELQKHLGTVVAPLFHRHQQTNRQSVVRLFFLIFFALRILSIPPELKKMKKNWRDIHPLDPLVWLSRDWFPFPGSHCSCDPLSLHWKQAREYHVEGGPLLRGCDANPDTRVKIPDVMRINGYSPSEAADRSLQMQVRHEADKIKGEAIPEILMMLQMNVKNKLIFSLIY
jgi:hypothetical protein